MITASAAWKIQATVYKFAGEVWLGKHPVDAWNPIKRYNAKH
jgi:hypothetical protein